MATTYIKRSPLLTWSAYAACTWSFVFAALSFYWALGGSFLSYTQSPQILALTAEPWFIAVVWLTGFMKVLAGLLALSLVQRWGERFPVWLRRTVVWGVGLVLALYSGANLGARGLMALGILETPASMRSAAATWHLILWDPWFLLGGVLFLLTAWHSRLDHTGTTTGHRSDKVSA